MKIIPRLDILQRHLAFAAICPTTLRNMFDKPRCRESICSILAQVDLEDLTTFKVSEALDRWTDKLRAETGVWGPSRKALNLFLRDASYNYWIRLKYGFERIEKHLEAPLDANVMMALRRYDRHLPQPPLVKWLDMATSNIYQEAAARLAADQQSIPIHLDLVLWNGGSQA